MRAFKRLPVGQVKNQEQPKFADAVVVQKIAEEINSIIPEIIASIGKVGMGQEPSSAGTPIDLTPNLLDYLKLSGRDDPQVVLQKIANEESVVFQSLNGSSSPHVLFKKGASTGTDGGTVLTISENGSIELFDDNNYVAPGGIPTMISVRVENRAWAGMFGRWATGVSLASDDLRALDVVAGGIQIGMLQTDGYLPIASFTRDLNNVATGTPINRFIMFRAAGDRNLLDLKRFSATQTSALLRCLSQTEAVLSYIDRDGVWNGPMISTGSITTGDSIIYNEPNTYKAAGATYSAASLVITGVGLFGASAVGQYVFGPDIPVGAKIDVRGNNAITLNVLPTGDHSAGADVYFGFGQYWKNRFYNRYWKLAGDTEDDTVTTYAINRTANQHDPIIPTQDYPNIFSKMQTITGDSTNPNLSLIPGGSVDVIRVWDGISVDYFQLYASGRAVSAAPDIWYQAGIGSTPSLTHSLLYSATSRTANWPDVDGTVVISPTPLVITNTSANVTGGTLHLNTGSSQYFRVGVRLSTNTTGDRSCTFVLKWTDGVARSVSTSINVSASAITGGMVQFIFVTSGSLTYDVTFSGTTGTADIRAIVERMS